MKTYCLKCKKNTKKLDSKIFKIKNFNKLCKQNVMIVEIKSLDL